MASVAQKDTKREAQIHDPPHQMQSLFLFPEGGWLWGPHTTRQKTNLVILSAKLQSKAQSRREAVASSPLALNTFQCPPPWPRQTVQDLPH